MFFQHLSGFFFVQATVEKVVEELLNSFIWCELVNYEQFAAKKRFKHQFLVFNVFCWLFEISWTMRLVFAEEILKKLKERKFVYK